MNEFFDSYYISKSPDVMITGHLRTENPIDTNSEFMGMFLDYLDIETDWKVLEDQGTLAYVRDIHKDTWEVEVEVYGNGDFCNHLITLTKFKE